ncbi:hypothetical protein HA402_009736 [Bradysia odoriphaga]|nr:hypothetical protein HA402_009736 [Bradysia odoriphaga]
MSIAANKRRRKRNDQRIANDLTNDETTLSYEADCESIPDDDYYVNSDYDDHEPFDKEENTYGQLVLTENEETTNIPVFDPLFHRIHFYGR